MECSSWSLILFQVPIAANAVDGYYTLHWEEEVDSLVEFHFIRNMIRKAVQAALNHLSGNSIQKLFAYSFYPFLKKFWSNI
jgi:hypothetical protein